MSCKFLRRLNACATSDNATDERVPCCMEINDVPRRVLAFEKIGLFSFFLRTIRLGFGNPCRPCRG
jgi:hypothetical protein